MILLMAEILHQLISSLSHYLQGWVHPRWLFGISEPSTVVCPDNLRPTSRCREIMLSSVGAGTAIPLALVFGKFGVKRSFFGALPGRFDV